MTTLPPSYLVLGAGYLFGLEHRNREAREARDLILHEIQRHEGPLIWIDNEYSERIPEENEHDLRVQMERLIAEGNEVHRVWGCEHRSPPFESWSGYSASDTARVFPDDTAAVRYFGCVLAGHTITLAGAWLGLMDKDQPLNRALTLLRHEFGSSDFVIGDSAFVDLEHEREQLLFASTEAPDVA